MNFNKNACHPEYRIAPDFGALNHKASWRLSMSEMTATALVGRVVLAVFVLAVAAGVFALWNAG